MTDTNQKQLGNTLWIIANLAHMKMLLHGVKETEFEIFHGDTRTNGWNIPRELNPAKIRLLAPHPTKSSAKMPSTLNE